MNANMIINADVHRLRMWYTSGIKYFLGGYIADHLCKTWVEIRHCQFVKNICIGGNLGDFRHSFAFIIYRWKNACSRTK